MKLLHRMNYREMQEACIEYIRFWHKLSEIKSKKSKQLKSLETKMEQLPKEGIGQDLFIILNGPSVKTQDLSLLKGKNLMFVNKGFRHPLYKELQPKYHVFVDPKLTNGTWDIAWIDEIFEMCPNIRVIFPIQWYNLPIMSRFQNDERIYWQHKELPFYVNGVSNNCFSYGIYQGFENIFFTGFDANGCAYEMIKQSEAGHFYGGDPELSGMTTLQHAQALFTTCLQLNDLNDLAKYCVNNNIHIYNLTNGGLLDMFPRRDFSDPYNIDKEVQGTVSK